MDDYEIEMTLQSKLKKYDSFLTLKKSKNIHDDILSVYLIEHDLLPHECIKCKCQPIWRKKPLPMVLDRINNIITDKRLENLRFVCPNCFSQLRKRTTRFTRITQEPNKLCIDCQTRIKNGKAMRCKSCLQKAVMLCEAPPEPIIKSI
jgi:hypothetical protein